MNRSGIAWVLFASAIFQSLGAWAADPVTEVSKASDPAMVFMSDSPWVGMEPEFKGDFKTGFQRLITGESPFGVYDPKIERAKKRLIQKIKKIDLEQAKSATPVARVASIVEFANKYSEPAKGEVITDFKVTFKLPDGSSFWMVVSADPATVEAQTMPVTFEEMRTKFQNVLDLYLYKAGAGVGLRPRVELASNHFHLGTATAFYKNEVIPVKVLAADGSVAEIVNVNRPVEEYAGVFRDYAVSIFNNPALAYFADDGYIFTNAPHPTWIEGLSTKLGSIIRGFDRHPTSVQALAKKLQAAYVEFSTIKPENHNPAKYVFYNMTRTADSSSDFAEKSLSKVSVPNSFNSMDELSAFLKDSGLAGFYSQTTEARGIGGQKSLKSYMAIMELYFDRLEYVRRMNLAGKGKIPMKTFEAPFSASHGATQLMYFVRETYEGLGRTREEITSKWKTLAKLIRQENVRDAAIAMKPFEVPLSELYSMAYWGGRYNAYRHSCTWLFQSSMNILKDDK